MGVGQEKEGEQRSPPIQLWDPEEGKQRFRIGVRGPFQDGTSRLRGHRLPQAWIGGGWVGAVSPAKFSRVLTIPMHFALSPVALECGWQLLVDVIRPTSQEARDLLLLHGHIQRADCAIGGLWVGGVVKAPPSGFRQAERQVGPGLEEPVWSSQVPQRLWAFRTFLARTGDFSEGLGVAEQAAFPPTESQQGLG